MVFTAGIIRNIRHVYTVWPTLILNSTHRARDQIYAFSPFHHMRWLQKAEGEMLQPQNLAMPEHSLMITKLMGWERWLML